MNDEDLARTVIRGYLQEIPRRIGALEVAVKNQNIAVAEREAQYYKGNGCKCRWRSIAAVCI